MRRAIVVVPFLVFLAAAAVGAGQAPAGSDRLTADFFKGMELRSLGPSLTTGRVADITVDPKNPDVYYVATAAGGLWKSENRGLTFTPVFDDGGSFNLSCVVVDPKNSTVVWLGTGENSNPRAAMFGDGVYKSTDAGKTWARMGLEKSEHIGNIKIDPRNSDVVYVAAQGPLWSAGGDRGVYKTTDGGKTWKAVLTVSADTGANEVVIDPNNPDVLYASTWQRRRGVGQFIGGGPESAIYKSTNAGGTWTKLAGGLPKGDMGRIALGVDPKAKPTRVYALCNAKREESGFYRSDDAGGAWARFGHAAGGGRGGGGFAGGGPGGGDDWYRGGDPGYYHELFVDPVRPDTIWSANTNLDRSEDGGKTWKQVPIDYNESAYGGVHVDFHAVWSDLTDRNHYMVGNDGGAYETYDDGKHYRHFDNLPVTQFYRVAVDNQKPFYKVCGGAQDNNSMCGPSRTINSIGIRTSDWFIVGGGDGFQSRIDPEDPDIIYATSQEGSITRLDLRTGVSRSIRPRAVPQGPGEEDPGMVPGEQQNPPQQGGQAAQIGTGGAGGQGGRGGRGGGDRTNWDCPYIISPHSPTRLYWGSHRLYRTDDRGDHWTPVSGDLTRNLDPTTIPIMGKVWPTDSVSYNQATTRLSTIVSIDESPVYEGLLYVGTDDGLLQVSEDGGKNWRKTDRFPGVPEGTYLTDVFASPRDANIVLVALNNWQKGDFKPYLMKSTDRGQTFTSIAGDLPDRYDVWSVVQDHINGNLLFAGTEFGLFFTVDGGNHWVQLKGGLPTCQVRDLAIQKRENDLAIATFGRGFYVLDDFSTLREVSPQALSQEAELYPLRTAYQYTEHSYERAAWGNEVTPNPPMGAVFTYSVSQALPADTKLVVTITDESGKQVRRLDQLPNENRQAPPQELPKTAGIHRIAWNLRGDMAAPAAGQGGAGGFGGRGGGAGAAGAGAGAGAAGGAGGAAGAGAAGAGAAGGAQAGRGGAAGGPPAGGGFGGRGGPAVEPGRYTAMLGKMTGDTVTPIGKPQSFMVVPLPAKNY